MQIKKYFLLLHLLCVGCVGVIAEAQSSFASAEKMLRDAIISRDIKVIELFVSKNGIPCGDSVVAKNVVVSDLNTKQSGLYESLFGNNGLSFRLRSLKDATIKYSAPFNTSDYQCAIYGVDANGDIDEVCMRKEAKGWYLSDSLYKCL
jgi:hypothetical protein